MISQADAAVVQAAASVAAIAVSLAALVIAMRTEHRAGQRFTAAEDRASRIASASIRPLLDVIHGGYPGRSVVLRNYGLGPAAITDVSFTRDGQTSRNLASLLGPDDWDAWFSFGNRTYYLGPADSITLLAVTKEGLRQRCTPEDQIDDKMRQLRQKTHGVLVKVAYTDVLGAQQGTLEKVIVGMDTQPAGSETIEAPGEPVTPRD